VFSWVTMHLWNWLMPRCSGCTPITWVQALGLLLLCKDTVWRFHRMVAAVARVGETAYGGAVAQMTPKSANGFAQG